MTKIKLTRTGRAPLELDGELVAECSTQNLRGDEQNRWYEIAIYQTENPPRHGGRYVAHVGYRTRWEGELDHDWVEVSIDTKDIDTWFSLDLFPIPPRIGWPPRREFDAKQAALLADLKSQYEYAVSSVLADFPETIETGTRK